MEKRLFLALAALGIFLAAFRPTAAQENNQAVFDEILDLYKSYDVILFGEQHDGKLNHDFRLDLLKSPKFADIVQDIVIESGNSLYQDVLDDFILKLKDVSGRDLQKVWRNTTMTTGVWDPPIYEKFIRAVRDVNAS
jgi:uncharacterized iron-regulated protein